MEVRLLILETKERQDCLVEDFITRLVSDSDTVAMCCKVISSFL